MTKHYAVNRWDLTGKLFTSTFGFATPQEAEERGRSNAAQYGDQTFSHTIAADNYNDARAVLEAQRLGKGA